MKKVINYMFVLQAMLCAVPAFAASEQVGGLSRECEGASKEIDRMIAQLHRSLNLQTSGIKYLERLLLHPEAGYHGAGTWRGALETLMRSSPDFSSQFRNLLKLQTALFEEGFFSSKMLSFLTASDLELCLSFEQVQSLSKRAGTYHTEIGVLLDEAENLLKEGARADFGSVLRVMKKALEKQRAVIEFLREIRTLLWFDPREEG